MAYNNPYDYGAFFDMSQAYYKDSSSSPSVNSDLSHKHDLRNIESIISLYLKDQACTEALNSKIPIINPNGNNPLTFADIAAEAIIGKDSSESKEGAESSEEQKKSDKNSKKKEAQPKHYLTLDKLIEMQNSSFFIATKAFPLIHLEEKGNYTEKDDVLAWHLQNYVNCLNNTGMSFNNKNKNIAAFSIKFIFTTDENNVTEIRINSNDLFKIPALVSINLNNSFRYPDILKGVLAGFQYCKTRIEERSKESHPIFPLWPAFITEKFINKADECLNNYIINMLQVFLGLNSAKTDVENGKKSSIKEYILPIVWNSLTSFTKEYLQGEFQNNYINNYEKFDKFFAHLHASISAKTISNKFKCAFNDMLAEPIILLVEYLRENSCVLPHHILKKNNTVKNLVAVAIDAFSQDFPSSLSECAIFGFISREFDKLLKCHFEEFNIKVVPNLPIIFRSSFNRGQASSGVFKKRLHRHIEYININKQWKRNDVLFIRNMGIYGEKDKKILDLVSSSKSNEIEDIVYDSCYSKFRKTKLSLLERIVAIYDWKPHVRICKGSSHNLYVICDGKIAHWYLDHKNIFRWNDSAGDFEKQLSKQYFDYCFPVNSCKCLFCIGGKNEDKYYYYNIEKSAWHKIASINQPMNISCVCSFRDRYLFAFGGIDIKGNQTWIKVAIFDIFDQESGWFIYKLMIKSNELKYDPCLASQISNQTIILFCYDIIIEFDLEFIFYTAQISQIRNNLHISPLPVRNEAHFYQIEKPFVPAQINLPNFSAFQNGYTTFVFGPEIIMFYSIKTRRIHMSQSI